MIEVQNANLMDTKVEETDIGLPVEQTTSQGLGRWMTLDTVGTSTRETTFSFGYQEGTPLMKIVEESVAKSRQLLIQTDQIEQESEGSWP